MGGGSEGAGGGSTMECVTQGNAEIGSESILPFQCVATSPRD